MIFGVRCCRCVADYQMLFSRKSRVFMDKTGVSDNECMPWLYGCCSLHEDAKDSQTWCSGNPRVFKDRPSMPDKRFMTILLFIFVCGSWRAGATDSQTWCSGNPRVSTTNQACLVTASTGSQRRISDWIGKASGEGGRWGKGVPYTVLLLHRTVVRERFRAPPLDVP